MKLSHLMNYFTLVKAGPPDFLLVSREGEKTFTWKLLISFLSPTIAALVGDNKEAVSLPFAQEELRAFLELVENIETSADNLVKNEVALFLGINSHGPLIGEGKSESFDIDKTSEVAHEKQVKEEEVDYKQTEFNKHIGKGLDKTQTENIHVIENDKIIPVFQTSKRYKKKWKRKNNLNCNICEISFLKEKLLKKHKLVKHKVPADCSICKLLFYDGAVFMQHMKDKSHRSLSFTCETCGTTFQSKTALNKHISWKHEDTEKVPCKYCGVVVQSMELHVKNKHENPLERCNSCDFQTRRKFSMKKHIQTVHSGMNLQTCEFCGEMRKNLSKHLERTKCGEGKSINERRSEACEECGNLFTTKDSLNKHIKGVHMKIKDRHCDQCEYSTYSGFNLKLHISKMHTGMELKKEKCIDCFKEVYNLPYHKKIYHQGS